MQGIIHFSSPGYLRISEDIWNITGQPVIQQIHNNMNKLLNLEQDLVLDQSLNLKNISDRTYSLLTIYLQVVTNFRPRFPCQNCKCRT